MNIKIRIQLDLQPLQKYAAILSTSGQKGFDEVMLKWIVRYKKFALARFRKNSRGGGEWPPLSPKTKKRVKKRSRLILIDSGTLQNMLEPVPTLDKYPKPGIQTLRRPKGIDIGFGGGSKHPYAKVSIAKLASIHHMGLGNVPVREILVSPTEELKKYMADDVKKVANSIKRQLGMR